MSLQGSLRQLGIADVLQTALAGRCGNLIVRRHAARAVLHIEDDKLYILAPDPVELDSLLEGFVHRGVLSRDLLEENRKAEPALEHLVQRLLEQQLLSPSELDSVLRIAAEDAILELLTWSEGEFRFDEGADPPEPIILAGRVGVDVGGMLLRAAQRLDEQTAIKDALGGEPHLFIPLTGVEPPVEYDNDPTATVFSLLDGSRTVDEVAMFCGLARFSVLRSIFACVRVGAARVPTPGEIQDQVRARIGAGDHAAARRLLLQWSALEPQNPNPLLQLLERAKKGRRIEEQADALHALGQLHVTRGEADKAQNLFRELLGLRPGDLSALEALCSAAHLAGDVKEYRRSALELAQAALDADDPSRAVDLLKRIIATPDAPILAHVIRGRAFVRLKDREALLTEAEAVLGLCGARAKRRDERAAASFYRDAIAALAPERSDLLRRFRVLAEGKKASFTRVALLLSLLAVAGTAGVMFWPDGAGNLLEQIRLAAGVRDQAAVQRLIAELADEHPGAPELEEAFRIQARLIEGQKSPDSEPLSASARKELRKAIGAFDDVIRKLPGDEARLRLGSILDMMTKPEVRPSRSLAMRETEAPVRRAVSHLELEIRRRVDTLQRARLIADGPKMPLEALEDFIEVADGYLQDEFWIDSRATLKQLQRLGDMDPEDKVATLLSPLVRAVEHLQQARADHAPDVDACRRILVWRLIEATHQDCLTQAPHLLVAGQLDDAAECYAALDRLLERVRKEEALAPLSEQVGKKRISQFLEDRISVITEIRRGLEAAKAAEKVGDLESALEVYRRLADKFYYVRFENVIRLPIRVESVPTDAQVLLNGKEIGRTPLVLRYAWGTENTLVIDRRGYQTGTVLLGSRQDRPKAEARVRLEPDRRWTAPVDPTTNVRPTPVGQDVLLADRSGRVTLLDGASGEVRWARQIRSLEGIRARPATSARLVYVPFVDGRMDILDARDGVERATLSTGRPAGDPGVVADMVYLATIAGRLVGFRGLKQVSEVEIPGRVTAGLVSAHGAVWMGFAKGAVLRVDRHGQTTRISLSGRETDIVGLGPHADGVLVTKRDGTLHALAPDGTVRWTAQGLGDVEGEPARAGRLAAAVDTRGRIMLYDVESGAPRGQIDLRERTRGGLLELDGRLVSLLRDGRIWIHDPQAGLEIVDVAMGGDARFPPAQVGEDRLAVSADGDGLAVLRIPRK